MSSNLFNSSSHALITGASSGLGVDFAHLLASRVQTLTIVARRKDLLDRLADEIKATHTQVQIHVIAIDLSSPEAATELLKRSPNIDILINNAGFGVYGNFVTSELDNILQMIQLNIATLTALTHGVLHHMKLKNQGGILNVASIAGFQACPYYAAYGASKSYVLTFTEALYEELRSTGIHVSALCPGPTETEFFRQAGQKLGGLETKLMMKSRRVAELGLAALENKKAVCVAGAGNLATIELNRLVPRSLSRSITAKMLQPKTSLS